MKFLKVIFKDFLTRLFLLSNILSQFIGLFIWDIETISSYLLAAPVAGIFCSSLFKFLIYGTTSESVPDLMRKAQGLLNSTNIFLLTFAFIFYFLTQSKFLLFLGPLIVIICNIQYVLYGEKVTRKIILIQIMSILIIIVAPTYPVVILILILKMTSSNYHKIRGLAIKRLSMSNIKLGRNFLWLLPTCLPFIEVNNRSILIQIGDAQLIQWSYQYALFTMTFGSFLRAVRQKILFNLQGSQVIRSSFAISIILLIITYFIIGSLQDYVANLAYIGQVNKLTFLVIMFCCVNYMLSFCIDYLRAKDSIQSVNWIFSIIFFLVIFEFARLTKIIQFEFILIALLSLVPFFLYKIVSAEKNE